MAYTSRAVPKDDGGDSAWLWIGGLGVLAYLWYEGYFSSILAPASSVVSGSTQPTVTQVTNGQTTAPSTVGTAAPGATNTPTPAVPANYNITSQPPVSLAPRSAPTSPNPLASPSMNTPGTRYANQATSVQSGSVVPTVSQVATPVASSAPTSVAIIPTGETTFNPAGYLTAVADPNTSYYTAKANNWDPTVASMIQNVLAEGAANYNKGIDIMNADNAATAAQHAWEQAHLVYQSPAASAGNPGANVNTISSPVRGAV